MLSLILTKRARYSVYGVAFFGLGIVCTLGIQTLLSSSGKVISTAISLREKVDSDLISPLLLCGESKASYESTQMTKEVSSYINTKIDTDGIKNISFYFRDLNNSKWTGVNEDDQYTPASLMKIPIMIAVYRRAETDPTILSKEIYFDGSFDLNKVESIKPAKEIEQGKSYSVSELIKYMISYSDNNATTLLLKLVSPRDMSKIFQDLGLPSPDGTSVGTIDYMSARNYAHIFRVLYNATYLSQEYSLKALELLLTPDFAEGLIAGIPTGMRLANKFGERTVYDSQGAPVYSELHDCGIVYYPNSPYLVCVMTKGSNFVALENVIKDISKIVYTNFQKN